MCMLVTMISVVVLFVTVVVWFCCFCFLNKLSYPSSQKKKKWGRGESEIIDFFLGACLKDEVQKIMPVQKQMRAGQQTRFESFGDYSGHLVLVLSVPRKLLLPSKRPSS